MDETGRMEHHRLRDDARYAALVAWVAKAVAAVRQRGGQVLRVVAERGRVGVAAAGRAARLWLAPGRLRDGVLAGLALALHAAGAMLEAWSRRAEDAVIYEAGQTASAGTLTCLNCGRVIRLKKTAPVPPCPDCLAARFRKTY